MQIQYKSTQALIDKINTAQESYKTAIQNIPSYSEYNADVQKRSVETEKKAIGKKLDAAFQGIENTLDVSIAKLTNDIYKTKYPLMSRELEENMKLRGTLEYQNALQLLNNISPGYPIKEIQMETFPMRYDFISALIDLSLARIPELGTGQLEEQKKIHYRGKQGLAKNGGVLDLMKEKLELEWLKKDCK
jgi:hypothetical protein